MKNRKIKCQILVYDCADEPEFWENQDDFMPLVINQFYSLDDALKFFEESYFQCTEKRIDEKMIKWFKDVGKLREFSKHHNTELMWELVMAD